MSDSVFQVLVPYKICSLKLYPVKTRGLFPQWSEDFPVATWVRWCRCGQHGAFPATWSCLYWFYPTWKEWYPVFLCWLSDIHHPDIHHLRHSSPPDWIQTFITLDFHHPLPKIRHSSPRHSSPQTFITHSCRIRHSSPRTFITSDIHHLRHSSPQTFITSDIHHPLAKIRHSSPQTFITSDIHHLRWWTSEVMNVWIQ